MMRRERGAGGDGTPEAGMRARSAVLVVGGALVLLAPPSALSAAQESIQFSAAGVERHAIVSPTTSGGAVPPVVVVLPHEGTTAQDAINRFGYAINRAGADAVALDALPCAAYGNRPCWAPMEAGDRRAVDAAAVDQLIDRLDARTDMDATRLVTLGESSGAAFAVSMTLGLPSRIDGALAISAFDPTRTVVLDAVSQVTFPLQLTGRSQITAQRNRQPITIVRGSHDTTIPPALSMELRNRLAKKGWRNTVRMITVGNAANASGELAAPRRITPRLRELLESAYDLDTTAGLVKRLAALGYLARNATPGNTSAYALEQGLMAFQGYSGLTRDGVAGSATRQRLAGATRPRPRRSGAGRHVEILIDQQVMLLVDDGAVVRAVHISSGAAGNTPRGSFSVYRKERMSWSQPFSSWMPYASYFTGGFAFHEYGYVPGYPASHGCVRIASPSAWYVYEFAGYGTPVYVM